MFKKIMASMGKGSASADVSLHQTHYQAGEVVEGTIRIKGGDIQQTIQNITVHLCIETPTYTNLIASVVLTPAFDIFPNEEKECPFSFVLPDDLPLTGSQVRFFFTTVLDIQHGVNKEFVDYIVVSPCTEVIHLFEALERIGFEPVRESGKMDEHGQEFAFRPVGSYRRKINEIEFYIHYQEEGIYLEMEIDTPGFFSERERKDTLFLPIDTLQEVHALTEHIDQWLASRVN